MNEPQDEGRRLYKARGSDGEVAWVDHEELWRLQQSQTEGVRQEHARRRRRLLQTVAGALLAALLLVALWWRSAPDVSPEAPDSTAATADPGAAELTDPGVGTESAPAPPDARMPGMETPGDESPAAPTLTPADRVAASVSVWADAWARQDLSAYLAGYSASFQPAGGLSRRGWESLRSQRLLTPDSIEVEIEQLEITLIGAGRAEARFVQRYRSPSYSDVVRKRLQLVEEEGSWRIVAEMATAL